MENGNFIGAILLDLSKAFVLINHDILLAKLSMYFSSEHMLPLENIVMSLVYIAVSESCIESGKSLT